MFGKFFCHNYYFGAIKIGGFRSERGCTPNQEQLDRHTDVHRQVSVNHKQVRSVSVKAKRPNHPSRLGGRGSALGGEGPPRQRRHVHDSIWPILLAVALGLKSTGYKSFQFQIRIFQEVMIRLLPSHKQRNCFTCDKRLNCINPEHVLDLRVLVLDGLRVPVHPKVFVFSFGVR